MRNLLVLFLGVVTFLSCTNSPERPVVEKAAFLPVPEPSNFNKQEVPDSLLALGLLETETAEGSRLEGNLFGKFFKDRASFFIVESPANKIYNSEMKSITLYYLDGELSKTKYILKEDVLDSLIAAYGKFKIRGCDMKNRNLITAGKAVVKTAEGFELNSQFDNFEINWVLANTQISYRVNMHEEDNPFCYVEKKKNYEIAFREIERRSN